MTERQSLDYLKKAYKNFDVSIEKKEQDDIELEERKLRWMHFWRNNPSLYAHYKLGIHLFPYQHYGITIMDDASEFVEVSTRGTSKTYKALVYLIIRCMLYPGEKCGFATVTRSQAEKAFRETFENEIVGKFSWLIKYLYQNGLISTKLTDTGPEVTFWNGSALYFFPVLDSSRGIHIGTLVIEECRLIKRSAIESIAIPMLTQRQPAYKALPEYVGRRDLDEPVRTIYITSNRYENEWFIRLYRRTFQAFFKNELNRFRVFNTDVYLGIKHGLRSYNWFKSQEQTMEQNNFNMEILNQTCGEADNAYFTREMFTVNRIMKKGFVPPTIEQFNSGTFEFNKPDNEYRFVVVDFAFTDDVMSDIANTIIGCFALYKHGEKWCRRMDWMERTSGGSQKDYSLLRLRELFQDYQADYLVYDNRNGGSVHYTDLTKPYEHPYRHPDAWNEHGFTISRDNHLHMMNQTRLEELKNRTVDPDAIPCMIPIAAAPQFNSDMWQDLSKRLRSREIDFLIDDMEYDVIMEEQMSNMQLTSEEVALKKNGYIQTSLMVNEAVSLEQEWRGGILHLRERSRRDVKDRIIVVAYANIIMTRFANHLEKKEFRDSENDWDNIKLVF